MGQFDDRHMGGGREIITENPLQPTEQSFNCTDSSPVHPAILHAKSFRKSERTTAVPSDCGAA